MNTEKIMQAVDVIEEVAGMFIKMPEEQKECLIVALQFQTVSLALMELAKHLLDDKDPYDACLAVARGGALLSDIGVRDSQITILKLTGIPGRKE